MAAAKKKASTKAKTVKRIVALPMSGGHDGQPWPKPGGEIELTADQAEQYEAAGIVVKAKDVADAKALAGRVESAKVDTEPS